MALELVHGKPNEEGFAILDLDFASFSNLIQLARDQGWEPSDIATEQTKGFSDNFYWTEPARVPSEDAQALAQSLASVIPTDAYGDAKLPSFVLDDESIAESALEDPNLTRLQGLTVQMVEKAIDFFEKGDFRYAAGE